MAVKAMKRVVIFVLCLLLILSGCSKESSLYITKENGMHTASFLAMDTVMSFSIISRNAEKNMQKAYEQIVAYDAAFSAIQKTAKYQKQTTRLVIAYMYLMSLLNR
jgi:thiamine biosynthesis lipoprotein ApbE